MLQYMIEEIGWMVWLMKVERVGYEATFLQLKKHMDHAEIIIIMEIA